MSGHLSNKQPIIDDESSLARHTLPNSKLIGKSLSLAVRPVSFEELRMVEEVQLSAWGMNDRTVVPSHILGALAQSGHLVLGAYQGGQLIGFSLGWIVADLKDPHLYIHMTGVDASAQGKGVGYELKLGEAAWCQQRGIDCIRWTYDPMETQNANLYLHKIPAQVVQFKPDCYGSRDGNSLQQGLPTDRFVVEWQRSRSKVTGCSTRGVSLISIDADDVRINTERLASLSFDVAEIPVPLNFQELKQVDFDRARRWHGAVGETTRVLLESGKYIVSGFNRSDSDNLGYYVVTRRVN